MSEKYSSTLSWCFALGAAVLLFLLVLNSGAYGWSSPGDAEWVGSLDAEDKRHHCSLLLSRTALSYFHGTASTCLLHSKNKVLAPFFSCSIPLFFFFSLQKFWRNYKISIYKSRHCLMLDCSTNTDSVLLLLDPTPSAHCLNASTPEKRTGGRENILIQRLTPQEERRQSLPTNDHLGKTHKNLKVCFIGKKGGLGDNV